MLPALPRAPCSAEGGRQAGAAAAASRPSLRGGDPGKRRQLWDWAGRRLGAAPPRGAKPRQGGEDSGGAQRAGGSGPRHSCTGTALWFPTFQEFPAVVPGFRDTESCLGCPCSACSAAAAGGTGLCVYRGGSGRVLAAPSPALLSPPLPSSWEALHPRLAWGQLGMVFFPPHHLPSAHSQPGPKCRAEPANCATTPANRGSAFPLLFLRMHPPAMRAQGAGRTAPERSLGQARGAPTPPLRPSSSSSAPPAARRNRGQPMLETRVPARPRPPPKAQGAAGAAAAPCWPLPPAPGAAPAAGLGTR